jgi:hypothetical protein
MPLNINQVFCIIGIFLFIGSCNSVLSDKKNGFSEEFVKYLENIHNYNLNTDEIYFLVLNVDCFTCNEQFIIDFSKTDAIPNMIPIICGIEGSDIINESLVSIKGKYPQIILDRNRNIDRYKISDFNSNVIFKYSNSRLQGYWDLGSGKYTDAKTGKILIENIINSEL